MPITILRDTGAKQTLLRKGVVELPSSRFTGQFAEVLGVGGTYKWLPLHQLYLRSELVTGFVLVAEAPNLLFKTVDFVMGNDVAGVKVSLDVSDRPVDSPDTRELEFEFPEVFMAYMVTHAQARKGVEDVKAEQKAVDPTFLATCQTPS